MEIQSGTFAKHSMHPADMLSRAVFVTNFLRDLACGGSLNSDGTSPGISVDGEQGLAVILDGLEGTIKMAIDGLTKDFVKKLDTK